MSEPAPAESLPVVPAVGQNRAKPAEPAPNAGDAGRGAPDHLPFLDGIRGIAILAVFLYHLLGPTFGYYGLPWAGLFPDFQVPRSFLVLLPFSYGWAGVAVFFVVSGFCIHLSYRRSPDQGWAGFFHRRFFRIFPAYAVALGVFSLAWPWGSFRLGNPDGIAQLVTHLFAVHNLDQSTLFGINPSFWSIAVEVQLYAIYPLLVLLIVRMGWRQGLLAVGAVELLIRTISSVRGLASAEPLPSFIHASPFAYWLSWSLGAYLSECYLQGRASRLFSAHCGVVAAVSFLLPLSKPTAPFAFLSFSWLAAIVIDRLSRGQWRIPPRGSGGLRRACWSHLGFLGVVSYSFYLFHQPIVFLAGQKLGEALPGAFIHPLVKISLFLLLYPAILLLSFAVFRLVERPSITLGKAVWKRMRRPAGPVAF